MRYPASRPKGGRTDPAGCAQHTDNDSKNVPATQRGICREVPDDDPYDFGCPDEAENVTADPRDLDRAARHRASPGHR